MVIFLDVSKLYAFMGPKISNVIFRVILIQVSPDKYKNPKVPNESFEFRLIHPKTLCVWEEIEMTTSYIKYWTYSFFIIHSLELLKFTTKNKLRVYMKEVILKLSEFVSKLLGKVTNKQLNNARCEWLDRLKKNFVKVREVRESQKRKDIHRSKMCPITCNNFKWNHLHSNIFPNISDSY